MAPGTGIFRNLISGTNRVGVYWLQRLVQVESEGKATTSSLMSWAFGQCFSEVLFVYKVFCDYESGTLNF